MPSLTDLLSQSTAHAWLFVPSAILLGALHGLEPGHSKTMMAAFIVAVRGTVTQAVLLGLAATLSHTVVVWGIALAGMYLWQGVDSEAIEPYFQLASAAIIIAIALWMLWRTARERGAADHHHDHDHPHDGHSHDHPHPHTHDHIHDDEIRLIDTGHGTVALEIATHDGPARWRLHRQGGHGWRTEDVTIVTERPDGRRQAFAFTERDRYLESVDAIPGPHVFTARLSLGHGGHSHDYDLTFPEEGREAAGHGLALHLDGDEDAHALAHADDIRRRFAGRDVTTWQIVLFGLTGGLIPCPAAITVLLLCLQLKAFTLGFALVLCFSIGLALTLVAVGVVAALGARHASRRWKGFGTLMRRAPYLSGILIILVGLYVGWHGWTGIMAG